MLKLSDEAIVDRATLAALFGVSEMTLVLWEAQGMPTVPASDPRPVWTPPAHWRVTRKAVASYLSVHPDSVSRLVASGGLDVAVVRWGGHGKPMAFDLRKVHRWNLERQQPGFLAAIAKDDSIAQAFTLGLIDALPDPPPVTPPGSAAKHPRRKS